jgi:DNA-binding transcriptional LysR family regulator
MDVIDLMRTFVAVADGGSFTAAAERLGLSRALASKYVAQLEERLGQQLLHRTTRSVALTDDGRAYLEPCRRLLDDFDDLEISASVRSRAPSGRIRLTAPLIIGEIYLADMLAAFIGRYPQVSIDLVLTDRFVNLIDEGFDLAIRAGELDDSSLIARRLAVTRAMVCASPAYIERHGAPQTPQELAGHTCIVDMNMRNGARWPFLVDGRPLRVEVSGPLSVNSATATRRLVLAGRGIGHCPAFVVAEDLASGRLVRLLQPYETGDLAISALLPQSRFPSPRVRLLIDFLARSFTGRLGSS